MRGFITYVPWPGDINNVRLCFESVAVLAKLLDRHIAIPDELHRQINEEAWRNGVYYTLHPSVFIDLDPLPVMRLSEVSKRASMYEIGSFLADSTVIEIEAAPSLEAFAGGRAILRIPEEALKADIIKFPALLTPFYAMIFASMATRRDMARYVRDSVRHPGRFEALAKQIADRLGEFHAMVIRRNEFITAYPQADIKIEDIALHLAETVPVGSTLLIATDEIDRDFFAWIANRYKLVYARDIVRETAPDWSPYHYSCVEQNLCALADTFLGTRLSTFSSYVNRLRGYRGGDARIRFTDGLHRTVRDDAGWPEFSWQGSWREGHPLWGREFREGWLC